MIPAIFTLATLALAPMANAITIYTSLPGSIPTQFLAADGLPAYDTVSQTPPPPPTPAAVPGGGLSLALPTGAVQGLSKAQRTDFVGISIELSISDNIIGRNGTFVNPIFLNHMQNLRARSGMISVRMGGNSQEKATLVPAISPPLAGATINKTTDPIALAHGSTTPLLTFSEDLFYAMSNISSLVNVGWYFGLPFLNPSQIQNVADSATTILGQNLLGLQMANEPDQYADHGNEPLPWGIPQYMSAWGSVRSQYVPTRTDLIAPNVCCSFKLADVIAAGFLQQFGQFLKSVSIQHYKDEAFCNGNLSAATLTPAAAFDSYLSHGSVQNFFFPYLNASQMVAAAGKDLIMLETNTASCGGFAGASDSYGAGLYLIDLALQAAASGFSQILFHNGGAGQFYNLFSPPPGNMSTFRQWTTASPYYSVLVMSEVMSESGSQVMDLLLNGNNTNTPGYAIYKNGQPIRLALFNYITDPSGANDIQVQFSVGGGATGQGSITPSSVTVKYFSSATGSAADKFNLTWAGQTMGDQFKSDGRLQGAEQIITIQCPNGICPIPVKAPQFALVFLDGVNPVVNPTQATQTFSTSVLTKLHGGTVVVPPAVLSTSNGRGGAQELFNIGGSSPGKISGADAVRAAVGMVLVGVLSGMAVMTGFGRW
ncbi:hypothetical protein FRB97_002589 [Tulasnella sp. 331]|nr:hypothetical protein FRB97_002589 [Tulasnella sp. 331]KAG8883961.1 hypothetical protein FRB98_002669 [Tulasnella sp. 332]